MSNNLICIDANFMVNLVNSESENSPFFILWEKWQNNETVIVAPTLFYYEVTNALYRMGKAGMMTVEQVKESIIDTLSFNIILYGNLQLPNLHQEAINLANQFNLSASYDSHYLALAQSLNCQFYTGDKRLYNSVKNKITWINLII